MAGFWICLLNVSQNFEYACDSKYARLRNMEKLWICKGHTVCWICLKKPGYSLIVPQYALICLNNVEYAWIYLNKQSSGHARILNVSGTEHWKSERFLRKPERMLLYNPQNHQPKAFHSHLKSLALPSQMVIFKCNVLTYLFSVHNILSLLRHEEVCLM